MPYFYKKDLINILFIHIPKTGGVSVGNYFSNKYLIPIDNKSLYSNVKSIKSSLQHITYNTIVEYNNVFNFNINDTKIISVVRNPYERTISDLFHFNLINDKTSKDEVPDILKKYLINQEQYDYDNHNIPQYLFITDNDKNLIPNIKILRTETLKEDMINLGYDDFDVKDNSNKYNVNYYDYLNNLSILMINDFFDSDFKLFNYNKIDIFKKNI
jgi:hypothetical protein